jgi:tetratricopeptide (TPR) repeat protein
MAAASLGPYRLDRELGAGGMGKVWRAEVVGRVAGLDAGRAVALKLVHPHLLETPGFFKRFLREAEIGKAIVHENVVRTFDADEIVVAGAHHHFLVMEYVEGQTLRGLLDELERVPEELCRHIGREVAKGLAAIHAAGVVHRDLKPENVLITNDHAVKVMDLGVARLADEAIRLSQSGAFVGSIRYAAPEQFRGGEIDGRADLFALGVVLYELATSQHPFEADDFRATMRRVLDETPRRCAELNPQLSPFFEEVVHALVAKNPGDRIAPAAELARVLDEGEKSSWWSRRASSIRATTKRPLRRIRIPRETALYGRDDELAKLRALFERAKSGEGAVAVVEGEAGIGKSRLVDEFVGLLQREGEDLHFLCGSYPPGGAATASGAFSTAYREQFGEAGAAGHLTQTPILVPAFDALLRGETTPAGVEPLTKDSLQTCFVHATRALAAGRPTVVLIDDLHFAPEEGRALFAAMAMAVAGHRVLLVGTARPGLDQSWLANLDRFGAQRMALQRLGPKDLVRLLADTLRSEHLAVELSGRIALKSDGNPFFVFEILRGLREGQFLTRKDDGSWATTRVIADIQIPSSVLDLVHARVADLGDDERNLLDVASCLGFEFDPRLAAGVLGIARIPSLQSLGRIEKRHRLVRSAGDRFVFDHHQVQEALYGGLSKPLREEYHAAIASALETRHAAAAKDPAALDGALCADLAEHFLRGGEGARALRYLDPALTHLEKGWLNDAAARLAERALAVPALLTGAARGAMLMRLASRLDVLGRRAPQRAAIEEALVLARESGDRMGEITAERFLGVLLIQLGRVAEAEEHVKRNLVCARETGDQRAEASATGNLGILFSALGRFAEARTHHERHLALATAAGDLAGQTRATGNLGNALAAEGRHAEALEQHQRQIALARRIGDRRGEGNAAGNLGSSFWSLGRFAEAQQHVERAFAIAREIGDRRGESYGAGNLGFVSWSLGRYADARERWERWLALAREIGDSQGEANATGDLGELLFELGRPAEARELLERHLALSRKIGAQRYEAQALVALGVLAEESADSALAERRFADALEIQRVLGARAEEALTLGVRGAFRARTGRSDEARADLEAALSLAKELSLADVEVPALAALAVLPGGDREAALAALAAHGGRVMPRQLPEVRLLLWQATKDRAHLAEAKRLLDDFVAHAPADCRESMLANVRVNREIVAACKEQGL